MMPIEPKEMRLLVQDHVRSALALLKLYNEVYDEAYYVEGDPFLTVGNDGVGRNIFKSKCRFAEKQLQFATRDIKIAVQSLKGSWGASDSISDALPCRNSPNCSDAAEKKFNGYCQRCYQFKRRNGKLPS